MTDQSQTPRQIQPEEYPSLLAMYQQWYADEQLNRAVVEVRLQTERERSAGLEMELARANEELRILRSVVVTEAETEVVQEL